MKTDTVKTTLRLAPGLRDRLAQAAERDHRSAHSLMVHYIEQGLTQDEHAAKRAARREAQA